ncbi:MAG: hypothetical protein PHO32_07160 [Candidatus Cloacimonetes bacterium]|nr:hypothetical protein [Candidatus Cloacimonadota bacterium]
MLKFAIYVSNHGFGHASRVSALAEEFSRFGIFCHIVSAKPEFLYHNLNPNYCQIHKRCIDFGVVHEANLKVNEQETTAKLLSLFESRNQIMENESRFMREEKISLVIADAPFLIADSCAYLGITLFALTNFEWHYIYKYLFAKNEELIPLINTIWALYQRFDCCFALPFSTKESVAAFRNVDQCGLLARKKDHYTNIRKLFGIADEDMVLLVMFGGEGALDLNIETLCRGFQGKVFSTFKNVNSENHITVNVDDDFLDLLHGSDIILCKPGYSTLAEATQMNKYIVYCPRKNYPEEIALIEGLDKYGNCLNLDSLTHSSEEWKAIFKSVVVRKASNAKYRNQNTTVAGKIVAKHLNISNPHARLLSVFDLGTNNLNYTLFDLNSGKTIHRASCLTGLGKGFKGESLSKGRLTAAKQIMKPFFELDSCINSEKKVIATGVSRLATNANDLGIWLSKKYPVDYSIISEMEESLYVYHAVKAMSGGEEGTIAVDLGGASTEFVQIKRYGKFCDQSLPIGLLNLYDNFGADTIALTPFIKQQLDRLQFTQCHKLIGVGLTLTYLSKVINKYQGNELGKMHGSGISLNALNELSQKMANKQDNEYLPYLEADSYLPILQLSTAFFISLLAKFMVSEIIVCEDGILVGYARWTLGKINKSSNILVERG